MIHKSQMKSFGFLLINPDHFHPSHSLILDADPVIDAELQVIYFSLILALIIVGLTILVTAWIIGRAHRIDKREM